MTRDDIDKLWQQALIESVKDGEQFARYHFAALVAAYTKTFCPVCNQRDAVRAKFDEESG